MSQLPVWGIDVTAASLRAVLLALGEDGKLRAEAWDVIDYAEDVEDVRSGARYDAMTRAVKRFLQHQNVRSAKVVASIRGETAFMRTVSVPQLDDESLDKILAYEAQPAAPRTVVSVADTNDTYDFGGATDRMSGLLPAPTAVTSIHRSEIGDLAARAAVLESVATGSDLVGFAGRGRLSVG